MALNDAPFVERRLYFPANGKEPVQSRPILVTFDSVENIPTPRICILPATTDDADGHVPEGSAEGSSPAQLQIPLSIGQATSTSQFERVCLGGADELDSHGAKAQHASENGWPWSRFRTEHVLASEPENERPGQRTIRVDRGSSQAQQHKVQSIVAGSGSTLDLWETKGHSRVYLVVQQNLVVGVLAVEHLLRTHKVRHVNLGMFTSSEHARHQGHTRTSPEACRAAHPEGRLRARISGAGSPPDIFRRPSTPAQPAAHAVQKGQKQLSLFDTLKSVKTSSLHSSTPQTGEATESCAEHESPANSTTPCAISPVALLRDPHATHSAPLPIHLSAYGAQDCTHGPFTDAVNACLPYSEPPLWCHKTMPHQALGCPGSPSLNMHTPPDVLDVQQRCDGEIKPHLEAQHSSASERRARMAAVMCHSGRRRGSRMARMQAAPPAVQSRRAPLDCVHHTISQTPAAAHASGAWYAPLGKRKQEACGDAESTAFRNMAAVRQVPDSRTADISLPPAADTCMHISCQIYFEPSSAAGNLPDNMLREPCFRHGGCAAQASVAEATGQGQFPERDLAGDGDDATGNSSAVQRQRTHAAWGADKRMRSSKKREKPRAVLGVRMLWVARRHRGKGLAQHLLDVARQDVSMALGGTATRQEVAWASWLVDAFGFASQYCEGPENVLLFNELHSASVKG